MWTAAKAPLGYGHFWLDGKIRNAHTVSYEHFVGPVPAGLTLEHAECQNPSCVRPDHMEAVTQAENVRRGRGWAGINARKEVCPRHRTPYDYFYQGRRQCKACRAEAREKSRRKAA